MSFRTWVYVFAIIGLTFSPKQATSQEQVKTGESAADTSTTQDSQPKAPSFVTAIEGVEAAIRELIREESEDERKRIAENAKKDLDAQTEMAKWASEMAIASIFAAIFTAIGLILIGLTLRETKSVLKEARNTTAAANTANQIMRDEQRPWISIHPKR